jgi:hypothetical protein
VEVGKRERSNTSTDQYECFDMTEDAPSGPRGAYGMCVGTGTAVPDSGAQAGRVVQGASVAAGGSVLLGHDVDETDRAGEPALGVMGGLQKFLLPPVSSAPEASFPRTRTRPTGSNQNPATPAPNSIPDQLTGSGRWIAPERGSDVKPGEVSPQRNAVPAAFDVAPTGRQKAGQYRVANPGRSTG